MRLSNLIFATVMAATVAGCSSTTTGDAGVGLDGGTDDAGEDLDMRGGANADSACAAVTATATLAKKPVDVIFVIDNSGSMADEIVAVQNNINTNFAQIIAASGLDYRVIMIARHGSANPDESVCISMPLSGNTTCSPPPAMPTNTANFFHYSEEIASNDSFVRILDTYDTPDEFNLAPNGWSQWLRPEAVKTFIEITDDDSSMGYMTFEAMLFAKAPTMFGDAVTRNYVWHTIGGFHENTPVTAPWQPADAVQMTECTPDTNSDGIGVDYQELSKLTGGIRFPICQFSSFDVVFQAVAAGVVSGAQVACEFQVPPPPAGQEVNLSTVSVLYTPSGGGAQQTFTQVASAAACSGAQTFYIEAGQIKLCPDTCTAVTNDPTAQVEVYFDCTMPIN